MKKLSFIFAVALLISSVGCDFGQIWLSNAQQAFPGCEIYQISNDNKYVIRNKANEVFLAEGSGTEPKAYVIVKVFSSQFNPNSASKVATD